MQQFHDIVEISILIKYKAGEFSFQWLLNFSTYFLKKRIQPNIGIQGFSRNIILLIKKSLNTYK